MIENKKAQADIINLLAGIIIIAGGIAVVFNYVNLGLLLGGLGALIEAIKIVLSQGVKWKKTYLLIWKFLIH